jgi:hypothetical protein
MSNYCPFPSNLFFISPCYLTFFYYFLTKCR